MNFAPTHMFYLTSLRCNERCTKCSHWKVREHPEMVDAELVVDAVRSVTSAKEFCIVGGEALVYRDRVLAILRGIADVPVRTTVVTNGVPCTSGFVDEVRSLNIHFVFSIDTLDAERWRWVRGTNSMDKVFRNLEYIRSTLRPEQLSIQSVLAEETRDDVAAVGRWCGERGIYHSVQRYVQGGFDGSWTPLSTPALSSRKVTDDVGPCMAADRNLSIMPDGSVYTCFQQTLIPNSAKPIGKLGERPVSEMLRSEYTEAVLRRMRSCALPCKVLRCNQ
ncbi:MAG: radical SAM protein [Deltaproteobacteria bacterium]|nr:radical SAM protein [Deltaproteobacteria bacterium]